MKIFVSYATKDQELIRDIVSTLEADGHEVWWDRNLIAGDNFRDEIVRALEGADIVLVVWTDISIGSSWVISEAGRAAQAGKLVAVRTPALPIVKLPPPFDVYHTEVLHDLEAVRKSVEVGRSSGAERSNIVRRRGANFLLHKLEVPTHSTFSPDGQIVICLDYNRIHSHSTETGAQISSVDWDPGNRTKRDPVTTGNGKYFAFLVTTDDDEYYIPFYRLRPELAFEGQVALGAIAADARLFSATDDDVLWVQGQNFYLIEQPGRSFFGKSSPKVLRQEKSEEVRLRNKSQPRNPIIVDRSLAWTFGGATIEMWDLKNNKLWDSVYVPRDRRHEGAVLRWALSPDKKTCLTGSSDSLVKLWNIIDGSLVFEFTEHREQISSVAIDRKGIFAASGDISGTINIWDLRLGELVQTIDAYDEDVLKLCFRPNSRSLASIGDDNGKHGDSGRFLKVWRI